MRTERLLLFIIFYVGREAQEFTVFLILTIVALLLTILHKTSECFRKYILKS